MPVKVKEINEGATVSITVNKSFYLMSKALSFYLFQHMQKNEDPENYVKETMTKPYPELDDLQRSFFTVALLLAEMEANFKNAELFTEKEVPLPGEEGYVEPTVD